MFPLRDLDKYAALIGNLAVLVLYLVFGFTLLQLIFVFWWECVWVGLVSWLKLLLMALLSSPFDNRYASFSRGSSVLLSLVILSVTAGKYVAVLGMIALVMIGVSVEVFGVNGWDVIEQLMDPLLLEVACWLLLSHVAAFLFHFLWGGEFRSGRWFGMLAWSYARIGALAAAIVVGLLWAAYQPGYPQLFGAVVVIAKIAGDHWLSRAERLR